MSGSGYRVSIHHKHGYVVVDAGEHVQCEKLVDSLFELGGLSEEEASELMDALDNAWLKGTVDAFNGSEQEQW